MVAVSGALFHNLFWVNAVLDSYPMQYIIPPDLHYTEKRSPTSGAGPTLVGFCVSSTVHVTYIHDCAIIIH